MITEVKQDLFTVSDNYYLVHCISSDFALGAGIAKKFAELGIKNFIEFFYPQIWDSEGYCLFAEVYKWPGVFNLVTKEHYWDKPTMENLVESLHDLKEQTLNMVKRGPITYVNNYGNFSYTINLAMPRIGCGLDRLSWPEVKDALSNVFTNEKVVDYSGDEAEVIYNILVCSL